MGLNDQLHEKSFKLKSGHTKWKTTRAVTHFPLPVRVQSAPPIQKTSSCLDTKQTLVWKPEISCQTFTQEK
jgi:hypothetical protein